VIVTLKNKENYWKQCGTSVFLLRKIKCIEIIYQLVKLLCKKILVPIKFFKKFSLKYRHSQGLKSSSMNLPEWRQRYVVKSECADWVILSSAFWCISPLVLSFTERPFVLTILKHFLSFLYMYWCFATKSGKLSHQVVAPLY